MVSESNTKGLNKSISFSSLKFNTFLSSITNYKLIITIRNKYFLITWTKDLAKAEGSFSVHNIFHTFFVLLSNITLPKKKHAKYWQIKTPEEKSYWINNDCVILWERWNQGTTAHGYLIGLSSIGHSVLIHRSCQYRRYSDISKEPEKTR